jgi:hypothetical protein
MGSFKAHSLNLLQLASNKVQLLLCLSRAASAQVCLKQLA